MFFRYLLVSVSLLAGTQSAFAAPPEFTLVIKDHIFQPKELKVPAGQRVKIIVDNQDATTEEFESHSLHREKLVSGNSKISVFVGPLKAGSYEFFGEFNQATAQGVLIAE